MKADYYSPLTIALLNQFGFFAIDQNWCCFFCGEVHEDAPIVAAIAHLKLRHPDKVREFVDLRTPEKNVQR
jgi:hypothetical protein